MVYGVVLKCFETGCFFFYEEIEPAQPTWLGKQKTVEIKLRTAGDQLLVELSNVLETRGEAFPAEAKFRHG